ncbi:MAG: 16S rRNA (cytidine(1402)-2'-O)-methyltransferase [Lachnospiraceae bacterium]|nr:16S rRNA (cytidine(1402)-2'-O)-methyltransferase [Lachnospiraceae bacterium]
MLEDLQGISGHGDGKGMLYLCATPIGNLEDITFRVLRILKEVDLIAAEDTRNSIKLLNHFEIKTPMTSYHEYNKVDKAKTLVAKMLQGVSVAVITDAGTPGISDPGEELVRQAHAAGIPVTSLPGPAACITALTMSGQATRRFAFEAFLPADKKERAAVLEELANETRTMIIYEAPHHLKKTLKELAGVLGEDRHLSICKELTKTHETTWLTTLVEAMEFYETKDPRGEYVLVIEGKSRKEIEREKQEDFLSLSLEEHLNLYLSQGMEKKEAMKAVAKDRGISKRDVYNALLES